MYYDPVYVCVFWIANVVLWFAVCIDNGNDMHRFTFLPLYQACRTQNWLRVKSEVQLGTLGRHVLDVSKMFGQTLRVSSLHQNKFMSMYAF